MTTRSFMGSSAVSIASSILANGGQRRRETSEDGNPRQQECDHEHGFQCDPRDAPPRKRRLDHPARGHLRTLPQIHAACCMPGRRGRGATHTCAGFLKRLAGSYPNSALRGVVAREGQGRVVFPFRGWKNGIASREKPEGTPSFL